jgi:hypothetical protein
MNLELIPIDITEITIKYIGNCFEVDEDCMMFELKIPNIGSDNKKTISFYGWCLDNLVREHEYTCTVIESSKTLLSLYEKDNYYDIYLTYSEFQKTLNLRKMITNKYSREPNSDSVIIDKFQQCIQSSYNDPYDNELIWYKLYSDHEDF